MQITISPHLYGLLLIIFPFPFQIFTYFARKSDIKRKQIFQLSLCYISLNLVWYLTIVYPNNGLILEQLLNGSSIVTICYSYYFWAKEIKIKASKSKIQILIINLLLIFYAISVGKSLELIDFKSFYFGVFTYTELLVVYFAASFMLKVFRKTNLTKRLTTLAVLFSISISFIVPVVLFFFENELLKYLAINLGFLFVTIGYTYDYIVKMKLEFDERSNDFALREKFEQQSIQIQEYQKRLDAIEQIQNLETTLEVVLERFPELTERQSEVAKLIALGFSYSSISEKLYISEETVRKHVMDACQKMGLKGYKKLRDFLQSEVNKTKPM